MTLSALTVQQLRYLVALDEARNFRDAAQACYVSQPALSAQVKKVEELLGTSIFDRARQPIVPTELGAKILQQARCALEQFDRIGLIAAEGSDIAGVYRLGVIPTLASTLLPLFVPHFALRHPRVSLEIVECKTEEMLRELRAGQIDAGLASTPLGASGLREHPICREAFCAYLPLGHRLCEQRTIAQEDLLDDQIWLLADGHCFRTQVLSLCSEQRRARHDVGGVVDVASSARIDIEVGSFETLVGFVDAGLGVTVLPELFVQRLSPRQREQQVRRFRAPQPVREIALVCGREHLRWSVFTALLAQAVESIPRALEPQEDVVEVIPPHPSDNLNDKGSG